MKKIGILTFHRALNYGALLQAYGLVNYLTKNAENCKVEIIDYRAPGIEKNRSVKNRFFPFSIKNTLRTILLIKKINKFDIFLKKYLPISSKIYTEQNISDIENDYDIIFVGSDQVWNTKITENDYNFFLAESNIKNKKKINSYAASVGLLEYDNIEKEKISAYLKKFNHISIRESASQDIFEDMNIKIDGVHVDPTLLISYEDWNLIVKGRKIKDDYILVYNVKKPDNLLRYVKKFSNENNLKIVYIPNGIKPKGGKIMFPNINEFLSLFHNAKYIFTNSFHGTVFSIIFHKKMLVELKKDSQGNNRIINLLKECGLSNRIVKDDNYQIIENDIDWNKVDFNLSNLAKKSQQYLTNIIKEEE